MRSRNELEADHRSELENECGEKIVIKEFKDGYILIRTKYPDDVVIIEEGFKTQFSFLRTIKVPKLDKQVREADGCITARLPKGFQMASFPSCSGAGLFTALVPSSSPTSSVEFVVPFDALVGFPEFKEKLQTGLFYLNSILQEPPQSEDQKRALEYAAFLQGYFDMVNREFSTPVSDDNLQDAMFNLAEQYRKFTKKEAEFKSEKEAFAEHFPIGSKQDFVGFAHQAFVAAASIGDPADLKTYRSR